MKKTFLLIISFLFLLVSCSNGNNEDDNPEIWTFVNDDTVIINENNEMVAVESEKYLFSVTTYISPTTPIENMKVIFPSIASANDSISSVEGTNLDDLIILPCSISYTNYDFENHENTLFGVFNLIIRCGSNFNENITERVITKINFKDQSYHLKVSITIKNIPNENVPGVAESSYNTQYKPYMSSDMTNMFNLKLPISPNNYSKIVVKSIGVVDNKISFKNNSIKAVVNFSSNNSKTDLIIEDLSNMSLNINSGSVLNIEGTLEASGDRFICSDTIYIKYSIDDSSKEYTVYCNPIQAFNKGV